MQKQIIVDNKPTMHTGFDIQARQPTKQARQPTKFHKLMPHTRRSKLRAQNGHVKG